MKNAIFLVLFSIILVAIPSFSKNDSSIPFSTDSTHLTIWNGDKFIPIFIKGINLGIAKPGTSPGELEASREQYQLWFKQIKDAGFNCIRIYTLHYPHFYEELYKYNSTHLQHPLFFFQGVWLNEENHSLTKDLVQMTDTFRAEIKENIDCVHGNKKINPRFGKASGTYTSDVSNWNLGYIIGREISPAEVLATNKLHPTLNEFVGDHLSIQSGNASEVWLTSNLNYVISYEKLRYKTERPVSASSWPTLDPIVHHSELNRDEDTASVDLSKIKLIDAPAGFFVSYHAYPYYPDFISADPGYKIFSDNYGPNSYLGYINDLKRHYKNFPLIIAEYGVPSSWGVAHYASSGMNHGGFDELSQGDVDIRILQNLRSANTGGGIQFAWMDEWFKRTWITDALDFINRPLWHNITAAEQNFGLIKFVKKNEFVPWTSFKSTDDLTYIKAKTGFTFFEMEVGLKEQMETLGECWVAFDTYDANLGESILPTGFVLPTRSEFALHITQSSAKLYVTEAYDLFGLYHQETTDKQKLQSTITDGAPWNLVRWKNNAGDVDVQYIGELKLNHDFQPETSTDAVTIYSDKIKIRLPWSLLQFADPSQMRVFHDDKLTAEIESRVSDGISVNVQYKNKMYKTDTQFVWDKWTSVKDADVTQEFKASYWTMYDQLQNFNSPAIAFPDSFDLTNKTFPFSANAKEGVLANDFDADGQVISAVLNISPAHGFVNLNLDGSFTYTPQTGFNGTDSFTYSVFDGQSLSTPNKVILKVGDAINDSIFVDNPSRMVTLYPNPASNYVLLSSELMISSVKLFSLSGVFLGQFEVNRNTYRLDLAKIHSGVYLVVSEIYGKAYAEKLIVK